MGLAKANEILFFGKKLSAQELLDSGFAKYARLCLPASPA